MFSLLMIFNNIFCFLKYIMLFLLLCDQSFAKEPNFIFLLTDDQDSTLGGMIPLKKVHSLIAENGVEFTEMFVTTPLCCPSRASILTGKYAHHHGVVNNSINGNCNSILWQKKEEPKTFVTYLKANGYSTFYAGKYLNQYGKPSTGGTQHIPIGWDHWITLVGNSVYYNYSLSVNGKQVYHGFNYEKDYLTNVIAREANKFLHQQNGSQPFFMFLSFPAPHSPFTAAPQYQTAFPKIIAPRTPNFNIHDESKHWLLRQPPSPLPDYIIDEIDSVFHKRWQTLLSVDDAVDNIMNTLEKKKWIENTYVIFTSDNGFHCGQFSLPWDKRQPYEFDVRVPLLVRGPSVSKGRKCNNPVLNIDIAPTILDLAGIPIPDHFDGQSFAPSLHADACPMNNNRSSFIIEHQGEASDAPIPGCPQYKTKEVHTCEIDCICEDSWNNTYTCVRTLSASENSVACFFKKEDFLEVYNLTADPFQLHNLAHSRDVTYSLNSFQKLLNFLSLN